MSRHRSGTRAKSRPVSRSPHRCRALNLEWMEDRALLAILAPIPLGGNDVRDAVYGDFNGDGLADLATVENGSVGVRLAAADGTFAAPQFSATGGGARTLSTGDFNDDGSLDIVTANPEGTPADLSVLLGEGDGTFQPPASVTLNAPNAWSLALPSSVMVADITKDGNVDLVVWGSSISLLAPYAAFGFVRVLPGDGSGGFLTADAATTGTNSVLDAALADFDGDGNLDLVTNELVRIPTPSPGTIVFPYVYRTYLRLGNGDGSFQAAADLGLGGLGIVAADFDGDTLADLAILPAGGADKVAVVLNNADGTFQAATYYELGGTAKAIAAADFDGDGALDLVTINGNDANTSVLLGEGNGTFQPALLFVAANSQTGLAVGDSRNDGFPDVAAFDASGLSVLPNDGAWGQDPSDPPPAVSVGDATVSEGDAGITNAAFTVALSAPSAQPVVVRIQTEPDTATPGDFLPVAPQDITFLPGETTKTVLVGVVGDQDVEPDETFRLSAAVPFGGATIADGQGVGTILNDDVASLPALSVSDVSRAEGRRGRTAFRFTVTLSAPSDSPVTVQYSTANGTAQAGSDYFARSGTLTFRPGETTKTVTVYVRGDRMREAHETFFLNLGNSQGASIDDGQGLGTILDDDGGGFSFLAETIARLRIRRWRWG